MATQGTALIQPYTAGSPEHISATVSARFPTSPSAWGFLTDVDDMDLAYDGIAGNPIASAVSPEAKYLEPTLGQIWPR